MEKKYEKYYCEIPVLYSFAFILDPRVKLPSFSKFFAHIGTSLELDFTNDTNACDKLFELYAMYKKKYGNWRNQTQY